MEFAGYKTGDEASRWVYPTGMNNEEQTTCNGGCTLQLQGTRDMLAGTFNVPRRINGEV